MAAANLKCGNSFRIDIDNDWLVEDESWHLPAYETEPIPEDSTIIELRTLRKRISEQDLEFLRVHLSETYARYLASRKFHISVNRTPLAPITFELWAYPPTYGPKDMTFELRTDEGGKVKGEIVGGLVREKEPGGDDYGVYFYCNDRLIAKEIKDKSVGYISRRAGIPHSDASLARVIVSLQGAAKEMPWTGKETDEEAEVTSVAKLVEEMKALPSRVAERLEESGDPFRRRRMRRFHPMMFEEIMHMTGDPGDPVGILVAASMIREDAPWIYELAMEVYRAIKSGDLAEIEREKARLERFSEFSLRGGFMEEFGFGGKESHMFLREFPRMLQHMLTRTLKEKKPATRRRSPRPDSDHE